MSKINPLYEAVHHATPVEHLDGEPRTVVSSVLLPGDADGEGHGRVVVLHMDTGQDMYPDRRSFAVANYFTVLGADEKVSEARYDLTYDEATEELLRRAVAHHRYPTA